MSFNPRPPLLAGESGFDEQAARDWFVSIHARHCWRANRSQALQGCCSGSFNPRPPLLAGESRTSAAKPHYRHVSIHARHCWRANPAGHPASSGFDGVSIHARHCWRANQTTHAVSLIFELFQSTPAIAGGRICSSRCRSLADTCFNPRPPLLAGESRLPLPPLRPATCFNPRPPLLAGESPKSICSARGS